MSATVLRSLARQVSQSPLFVSSQRRSPRSTRCQTPRSALGRSVRFASTGKQQTLKERVTELIPVELEKVSPHFWISVDCVLTAT